MSLFSGQGKIFVASRVGGNPVNARFVGNVPTFVVNAEVDTLEHTESTSGQRLTDLRLSRQRRANVEMTLEQFDAENLSEVLFGTVVAQTTGSVTNEALPNPAEVGRLQILAKQNISAVTVVDSTGTPLTLPSNQYRVNAKAGSIELLDITTGGPYVQPFKVNYTAGAADQVGLFTRGVEERWVRFEGVNTADTVNPNRVVIADFYRVTFDPAQSLGLIQEDLLQFALRGSALIDETRAANDVLGQFGRIIIPGV